MTTQNAIKKIEKAGYKVDMKETHITCPLCGADAHYKQLGTERTGITHMWKCKACPFIGMEFYSDLDAYFVYQHLVDQR